MEWTGTEWTGPDRMGLEGKGFPSGVHTGKDRIGVDWRGSQGTGFLHASTKEWRVGEGIGAERRG